MAKVIMPSQLKKFNSFNIMYMLRSVFCLYNIQQSEMYALNDTAMLLNGKLVEIPEIEIGVPAPIFDRVHKAFPQLFDPKKKVLRLRERLIARRLEVIKKSEYQYQGPYYIRKLEVLIRDAEDALRCPSLSQAKQKRVTTNLLIMKDKTIQHRVYNR
ncbi:hypothetical protein AVT69_gp051 [Pseudomonas phage PhiPA3]|uniref:Uncharacterized protein 050 n=1 Tax=Pseudomonas phage PhiPA3 TaxID=998086 RepID=F8SJT2_BPPA3|nr:hypothetical protein AVT69_gp051 [Pseudomonas phage PhiPA3]AEH03477.1 hypothetical protein [Pseudomonas phage PhiPA3]